MLREWIVTLHNKEDLESFYEDMETPGGNLTIPDRQVQCANKRPISRNTHYMLTDEEAAEVRADPRVWDVDLRELVDLTTVPQGYTITNGEFDKSWTDDASDINWGLLRHNEEVNRSNWGANGTSLVTTNLTMTASGKNVDVVIVDGHIDPDHPEFAVNPDGSGGTRVVQYNWFQNDVGSGTGTYTYTPYVDSGNAQRTADNNHGCHCAGTVAGNTQGWARDANIYNISPYSTNPNSLSSSLMWDYIRAWHNNKPINEETGRRNPTITNNSYGSVIKSNATSGQDGYTSGVPTEVTYRGVTYSPGRELTQAELQARGFYCPSDPATGGKMTIPYYFTSRQADIQDAIDDGIIVVASAGNASWKIVNSSDQDYNNKFDMTYNGSNFEWWLNRGTGSGAGYAPVIVVGATSNDTEEDKAPFSNCGSQVDIYAAGEAIQSSVHEKSGDIADPRDSNYNLDKYQGTSMSGPQVAGVLAVLAESWQNIKQADAQTWLVNNASTDQMQDTETDDPMDLNSLQGGPNKYLRWIPQRKETGNNFPLKTLSYRPASGTVYPRPKIQKTKYSSVAESNDPTYAVAAAANNVNEGSNLTFTVTTENVSNGTTLYWKSSRAEDTVFDSGNVNINNNSGSFVVQPNADETTEGDETFRVTIHTGSANGPQVAQSDLITINDTSTTPSFSPDYTITVTTPVFNYIFNGTHRGGNLSDADQPALTFNAGDKVRFNIDSGTQSSHPFYLKTQQGTGTGNQISGVTGQGGAQLDWTVGSAGTYYYQCEFHGSMNNTITVS